MSRKILNTLFITLQILSLISLNIFLISCDEYKKSTILKENMEIEITSEPLFFKAIQDTLDKFDEGVFVSYDYLDASENTEKAFFCMS